MISDVEHFYKQRALIEKEYATKLQALCAESFKRKAKVSTHVSVGDEPAITPGSLECSTLVVWTEVMNKTELVAKEHSDFLQNITNQVVLKLSSFKTTAEGLQKKYGELHLVAVKERDNAYAAVKKSKHAYDSACEDMEHARAKTERSAKEKLQKKLSDREDKMNIAKNAYLVSVNQANRLKDKFFYQDLPEVLDGLQDINEFKTNVLNNLWKKCADIEIKHNSASSEHLAAASAVVLRNKCVLDSIMFVKHNLAPWTEPADFYFEPSPIWHDDDKLLTGPAELDVLRERIDMATKTYQETEASCETLQSEISKLNTAKAKFKTLEDVTADRQFAQAVDQSVSRLKTFFVQDAKRVTAEVEMEYIQSNAGDHDLAITTRQEKKKSRFGFLKRGKSVASHSETASQFSQASQASGGSESRPTSRTTGLNRFRGLSVSSLLSQEASYDEATALYAYQASADDEVGMNAGERYEVIQLDDGLGWTKIKNGGREGLVPTSYVTIQKTTRKKGVPPKVAPRRGGKKVQHARVLYDYTADGDDEISVKAGETVVILERDSGDGWTKGEVRGEKGLFPSSYIEEL